MSLLDRAKAAAEQAATKAKEGVEDVQARKELHGAYVELGKRAFELIEAGTIDAAELEPLADRVRQQKARLEEPPATPG